MSRKARGLAALCRGLFCVAQQDRAMIDGVERVLRRADPNEATRALLQVARGLFPVA